MNEICIRLAVPSDGERLSRLREALWPETTAEEHQRELAASLVEKRSGTMPLAIFVAEASGGLLVGFLEAGLRSHADGCDPRHAAGFVEGWFISEVIAGKA